MTSGPPLKATTTGREKRVGQTQRALYPPADCRTVKVGPGEVRPAEVSLPEVRLPKVRPGEIHSTEVRPAEVWMRYVRILPPPIVPSGYPWPDDLEEFFVGHRCEWSESTLGQVWERVN